MYVSRTYCSVAVIIIITCTNFCIHTLFHQPFLYACNSPVKMNYYMVQLANLSTMLLHHCVGVWVYSGR